MAVERTTGATDEQEADSRFEGRYLVPPDHRIVAISDLKRMIGLAGDADNVADDQREFLERMEEVCE